MIKTNSEGVSISGSNFEIFQEVCHILRAIAKNNILPKELLLKSVDAAFMTDEEIIERTKELRAELDKQRSNDLFNRMYGDLF